MRLLLPAAALLLLLLLGGCQQHEVVYANPGTRGSGALMIKNMKTVSALLLKQGIRLHFDSTTAGSGQALAALVKGRADFTVPNSAVLLTTSTDTTNFAASAALRTLAPNANGVFYIFCHKNLPRAPLPSLVRGRTIWCGEAGSATRRMAVALLEHLGVRPGEYRIAQPEEARTISDSIVFSFGALASSKFKRHDYSWRSLEDERGINLAEGFVQGRPFMQAATLPAYTQGPNQPNPVVCIKSQSWYVCRADLPDDVAYELARALNPKATAGWLTLEEADLRTLPFPLHEGARQYRDRDRPSFVQRNAESLGLLLTLAGLLTAAGGALMAQRRRRATRAFDGLYERVAELELACAESVTLEACTKLAQEVKTLQRQLVHDMTRHSELSDPRAALLQQKLSSCLLLLHTNPRLT